MAWVEVCWRDSRAWRRGAQGAVDQVRCGMPGTAFKLHQLHRIAEKPPLESADFMIVQLRRNLHHDYAIVR